LGNRLNIPLSKVVILQDIIVGSEELSEQFARSVHTKKLRMPIEKIFGFSEKEVQVAYKTIRLLSELISFSMQY
jgi:hypothetical protein